VLSGDVDVGCRKAENLLRGLNGCISTTWSTASQVLAQPQQWVNQVFQSNCACQETPAGAAPSLPGMRSLHRSKERGPSAHGAGPPPGQRYQLRAWSSNPGRSGGAAGANGAGKTTTFKICGQASLKPRIRGRGRARWQECGRTAMAAAGRGLASATCPQEPQPSFPPSSTVRQNLQAGPPGKRGTDGPTAPGSRAGTQADR